MEVNKLSNTAEKILGLIDGMSDKQVESLYKTLQSKVPNFDKIVKKESLK